VDLELSVSHSDGIVVVRARGEIDIASSPQLGRALLAFDGRPVVLDLSRVSFLDAAGIAVVVQTDRRLRERGARLVLRDPAPLVRRLLEITGDDHLIEQS
jgi:anti-anti-sigma factor